MLDATNLCRPELKIKWDFYDLVRRPFVHPFVNVSCSTSSESLDRFEPVVENASFVSLFTLEMMYSLQPLISFLKFAQYFLWKIEKRHTALRHMPPKKRNWWHGHFLHNTCIYSKSSYIKASDFIVESTLFQTMTPPPPPCGTIPGPYKDHKLHIRENIETIMASFEKKKRINS